MQKFPMSYKNVTLTQQDFVKFEENLSIFQSNLWVTISKNASDFIQKEPVESFCDFVFKKCVILVSIQLTSKVTTNVIL